MSRSGQNQQILLQINHLNYRIRKKIILNDITLNVCRGEIVTIVGPNGAGKSTLLKLALGLQRPTSGRVQRFQGLRIGYVPQLINRDETMPIRVLNFIRLAKAPFNQQLARDLLAELGIAHLQRALLSDLSGGELRRVLLARAMLSRPDLLVLDEPTAGVDIGGQEAFYHQLNDWRQRQHFALLLVSHDLHLVMSTTDRVICLNTHICCQGQPVHVLKDPHYLALFSQPKKSQPQPDLAFYEHHHDHQHNG